MPKRSHAMIVRVTEAERRAWRALAEREDMPLSQLIRHTLRERYRAAVERLSAVRRPNDAVA